MKKFEIGEAVNLINGEKFMYVESTKDDMVTCVVREDDLHDGKIRRHTYHKNLLEKHNYYAFQRIADILMNL